VAGVEGVELLLFAQLRDQFGVKPLEIDFYSLVQREQTQELVWVIMAY
jgi:hypothetical protein